MTDLGLPFDRPVRRDAKKKPEKAPERRNYKFEGEMG